MRNWLPTQAEGVALANTNQVEVPVLVFRVKRIYTLIGLVSFAPACAPFFVVYTAPNPGIGGWIFFGGLALALAMIGMASLVYAVFVRIEVGHGKLYYFGCWKEFTILLSNIRGVNVSIGNVVLDVGTKRRWVIPEVFVKREEMISLLQPTSVISPRS